MSNLGRTFWRLLQNFFSWLARLLYQKERRPDCEEQVGLPTRVVHGKKISLDATSSTPKNRQVIQGRPPRHPGWARQNVFRQPSSKRRAVYDDRPHRKHRPALCPPLVQFDSIPRRSKPIFDGTHAAPTIRVEDWSILPPSRKSLSQRLSFITIPTRVLRLSGFIPEPRQGLLAVPATDSCGHLLFSSSSRTGRYKHVDQKESKRTDLSISKLALPSDLYGCATDKNLDPAHGKADDIEPRYPPSPREYFTRNLRVTARNTMPAIQRILSRRHFYSLPATGFPPLFGKDGMTERNLGAADKFELANQGPEGVIPDNHVAEVDLSVSIDSTISATSHEQAGLLTRATRDSHAQSFFDLNVPTKLPYADFGDVPYPFVFDLDFYLSEADVPATPLLLVSFPGLDSEFSSPATDYFDTPTPSPKFPVAPLLTQQTGLSDISRVQYQTSDSSRASGDLIPERSVQQSLDNSGVASSLHSSGVEDSQSEYSILSAGYVNDSVTSSDFGKLTGEDFDKSFSNGVDDTSNGDNTTVIVSSLSESRNAGESGGISIPETVVKDVSSTSDEDFAGMMNQIRASFKHTSCPSTRKSSCETNDEGDTEGHSMAQDKLTIDTLSPASTFSNRHRWLLEDLSFSVRNGKRLESLKKDRSTLSEQFSVASFITYPTVPEISFNNIAYSSSPRVFDNFSIPAGTHFLSASQEGSVSSQRKMHRATTPIKPLNPMLIPTLGVGVDGGIKGLKGGFEHERSSLTLVGQKSGGVGPRVADLPQVTQRKVMPEKF